VLMSQVLHHYHPRLVDLHNYTSTLSPPQKHSNWQTLNTKVLRKLHCPVSNDDVDRVVRGEKGAIERILWAVYQRVGEWEDKRGGRGGANELMGLDEELTMGADGSIYPWPVAGPSAGKGPARESGLGEAGKDRVIADQRDAIEVRLPYPTPRRCGILSVAALTASMTLSAVSLCVHDRSCRRGWQSWRPCCSQCAGTTSG
jgi:hypothetical protein